MYFDMFRPVLLCGLEELLNYSQLTNPVESSDKMLQVGVFTRYTIFIL